MCTASQTCVPHFKHVYRISNMCTANEVVYKELGLINNQVFVTLTRVIELLINNEDTLMQVRFRYTI